MARVLVVGDLHFCERSAKIIPWVIRGVLQTIRDRQPDLVVVLGDILDRFRIIDSVWHSKATKFLTNIAKLCRLLLLIGNHDIPNKNYFMSGKHGFTAFKYFYDNVTVADKQAVCVTINGFKFLGVPYCPNGRFAEGVATYEGGLEDIATIFGHQEFKGCDMNGISSLHGDVWPSDGPLVISGHIHQYQRLRPRKTKIDGKSKASEVSKVSEKSKVESKSKADGKSKADSKVDGKSKEDGEIDGESNVSDTLQLKPKPLRSNVWYPGSPYQDKADESPDKSISLFTYVAGEAEPTEERIYLDVPRKHRLKLDAAGYRSLKVGTKDIYVITVSDTEAKLARWRTHSKTDDITENGGKVNFRATDCIDTEMLEKFKTLPTIQSMVLEAIRERPELQEVYSLIYK
jgi:metallophosphoesterase superfamily enzyme